MESGARNKFDTTCSNLRSFGSNILYWRKYLRHCWDFSAPGALCSPPRYATVSSRQVVHHPHISWIDVSDTGASPWTTDGVKTLPNLPSSAPKQDKVRVPELWSSCVVGTLWNLVTKQLKGKHCMQFVFCCIAHFNVATVWTKFVCRRCVSKYLAQLRLRYVVYSTLVCQKNPVATLLKVR